MTAILATIGALIGYQSGSAQNEAMFLKNQSILKQAEASDQWAFYQAKSMKGHLDAAVAALSSTPGIKARFLTDKAKEDKEKAEIRVEAQKLQAQSRKLSPSIQDLQMDKVKLRMPLIFELIKPKSFISNSWTCTFPNNIPYIQIDIGLAECHFFLYQQKSAGCIGRYFTSYRIVSRNISKHRSFPFSQANAGNADRIIRDRHRCKNRAITFCKIKPWQP